MECAGRVARPEPLAPPRLFQPLAPLLDAALAPFPLDVQYRVRRQLKELGDAVGALLDRLGGGNGGPPRTSRG